MPFVKMKDGTEVRIGVRHCDDETLPTFPEMKLRGTQVRVTLANKEEVKSRSVCQPGDQFCRFVGRTFAARQLMRVIGKKLNSDDKRTIFVAICPEFKDSSKRKEKKSKTKKANEIAAAATAK